jgi:hypothetical protein
MTQAVSSEPWVTSVGFVGYVVALEQGFLSASSVSCCCYSVIVLYSSATAPEVCDSPIEAAHYHTPLCF